MRTWASGAAVPGAIGDEDQDDPLRPLCLGGPAVGNKVGSSKRGLGMTCWGGELEGISGPGTSKSGIPVQLWHPQGTHPYIVWLDPSQISAQ